MVMLEQVRPSPSWRGALEVALTRPAGVPERRAGDDPWAPPPLDRPRRATDDLAWLREAIDDPGGAGLRALADDMRAWEVSDEGRAERLQRLSDRGILAAAGFTLHFADAA
jgi:hypothetical protein